MIDSNRNVKPEKQEEDAPMGVVILCLLPFAILFWIVLTASFIGGIF